jgi:hypothetical protein
MSIPLIANLGFTEVSSAGNLNDKAGTDKSKLPVQLFKLTDNISGNLTMTNDSAHKKIILDTNGNTIINSTGSPITNNSSTSLELKGSGNVQSTLKTFTSSESSTSNTGTTTIATADNSTVAVSDSDHTFVGTFIDDNRSAGSGTSFGDGSTTVTKPNTGSTASMLVNETYYTTANTTNFGGVGLDNINRSDFGMSFSHAFLEDGTPISGAIVGPSGPSTYDGVSADQPDTNTTHSHAGGTYRFMEWENAVRGVNNGNSGTFDIQIFIDSATDKAVVAIVGGRGAFNQIKNVDVLGVTAGRRFTFTNNLAISCVLSGADPYDGVTVGAGATAVANRDSTDGSFSLTGTVSGSDGSSQPYSVKPVNDGTGSLVTTDHTGTRSASAF